MRPIFLLLVLLCAGCSTPQTRTPTGDFEPNSGIRGLPSGFDFDIKDGSGDSLIVHYFYGKLFISEQVGAHADAYSVSPTENDWLAFWHALEGVHIWGWGSGVDPGEPDFWSLHLSYEGHDLSIDGTHFKRGLDGGLSTRKEGWIVLASALQHLIRHDSILLRDSTKVP